MHPGIFSFDEFSLDRAGRRLTRGGKPVELSSRYFDALALLLAEQGKLVSKDRFMDEVWRGIPVTDEALTQCIRTLRRQLGDDAAAPRFIETVPKHGYRFIAPVELNAADGTTAQPVGAPDRWHDFWLTGAAGAIGGGAAGLLGGMLYGLAASAPAMGATTLLAVLMALTGALGLLGGAGVGFGIAATAFVPSAKAQWPVFGGMMGGIVVGALAKMIGLDALNLLFGHAPSDMTGAREGSALGAAVGLAAWLARGTARVSGGLAVGALAGALAGALIPLLGGYLLGGSLALLAAQFPDSRLHLDAIGRLLGEAGFGRRSQVAMGALEGLAFGAAMVGALVYARRYRR